MWRFEVYLFYSEFVPNSNEFVLLRGFYLLMDLRLLFFRREVGARSIEKSEVVVDAGLEALQVLQARVEVSRRPNFGNRPLLKQKGHSLGLQRVCLIASIEKAESLHTLHLFS